MAHEITITETGNAEFAFTGNRNAIWHGLGNEMPPDAPKEKWLELSGMNWTALERPMFYPTMEVDDFNRQKFAAVEDRKLIVRSDNAFQLGIVGNEYKVVQPADVMGFFDDLIRINGMKMSTAGTLFGGRRFWALAETGDSAEVVAGDRVDAYVLLVTAVDGTMSTQAGFTSTRVVCNNTLNVALSGGAKKFVKATHHKEWDANSVKVDMGLLGRSWSDYVTKLRALADFKMDATATDAFFKKVFFDPKKADGDQSLSERRVVAALNELADKGTGADMGRGTAWGALNAATELFTHWNGNRKADIQFSDSYSGVHAKKKEMVFDALIEMVA